MHFVKTQKLTGLKEVADYQNMFGGFGEAVHKYVLELLRTFYNFFPEFQVLNISDNHHSLLKIMQFEMFIENHLTHGFVLYYFLEPCLKNYY